MKNTPLTVYRIAHRDNVLTGPEGTQENGMPRCMAWECSNASFLSIPTFKKGRMFAFTYEQLGGLIDVKTLMKIASEGFVIYEIETTDYEVHEDQVTFDFDKSKIVCICGSK